MDTFPILIVVSAAVGGQGGKPDRAGNPEILPEALACGRRYLQRKEIPGLSDFRLQSFEAMKWFASIGS
jgi:hypothetical protein